MPLLASCSSPGQDIKYIAGLDLEEVSGMEYVTDSKTLWVVEDSGNRSVIYGLDAAGNRTTTVELGVPNRDWESLAADAEGNLYVGDFGNNSNNRKDLTIHKILAGSLKSNAAPVAATTTFYYPQQQNFPPKKSEAFYDAEAFLEHNGYFYIFSKNRSSKFDGTLSVYRVPNKPGNYPTELLGQLRTCGEKGACAVTAADISPDGNTIVLLTEDSIWLLEGFDGTNVEGKNLKRLPLGHASQKEGVCFKDDDTLLITDEQSGGEGGKLYEVKLSDLKGKP